MKKNSQSSIMFLLFVFLLLSNISSARVLQPKLEQGNQELMVKDTSITNHEYASDLMGLDANEACGNDKEGKECTERRLLEEAHLDYIYTQKLNKP